MQIKWISLPVLTPHSTLQWQMKLPMVFWQYAFGGHGSVTHSLRSSQVPFTSFAKYPLPQTTCSKWFIRAGLFLSTAKGTQAYVPWKLRHFCLVRSQPCCPMAHSLMSSQEKLNRLNRWPLPQTIVSVVSFFVIFMLWWLVVLTFISQV